MRTTRSPLTAVTVRDGVEAVLCIVHGVRGAWCRCAARGCEVLLYSSLSYAVTRYTRARRPCVALRGRWVRAQGVIYVRAAPCPVPHREGNHLASASRRPHSRLRLLLKKQDPDPATQLLSLSLSASKKPQDQDSQAAAVRRELSAS